MKRNLCVTGVLLVLLALAIGLGGCERAKPAPAPTATIRPGGPDRTPTIPSSGATPVATPPGSPEAVSSVTPPPSGEETPTPIPPQPTSPAEPAPTSVPTQGVEHVVAWGETIDSIANLYGVTAHDIVGANNLANPDLIRAGDVLIIPGVSAPSPEPGVHIVRQGETLRSIANMYGMTVDAIARANGIVNANYIWVGQRLTIPGGGAAPEGGQTYVVQPGDTLASIAVQFGTTAWAIANANNLPNVNIIYVGQTLRIP